MNRKNNNGGRSQNTIPSTNNSWGSFSSRYDRQPNYKKSEGNLNEQNNYNDGNSTPLYESNLLEASGDGFNNSNNAGVFDAFAVNQSDYNDYDYSSSGNNNGGGYQQNSNNYGSQQNQQSNIDFFGSQQNQGNTNNLRSQQNRSNSNNNFGPRNRFQSNSNNMKNCNNRGGSWLSGGQASSDNGGNQDEFNANGGSSSYVPFRKFRQHFSNRPNDTSSDGNTSAPSLFMGRDQSYPNELNHLMNPFFCGVCNSRLNSIKSANIHYESKAHDKQISNWMKKNFADKGLDVPEVQRFVTEEAIGPYRCELCKVDLTSAQHALQHYNGKRHRTAATKISPPTGIGYYNVDGNWVETGKVIDKVTGKETSYILVNTPSGFEPVVLHVAPNVVAGGVKRPAVEANKSEEQPANKKPNLEEPHDAEKEKVKKMKEEQYRTMITQYEKNKQQQSTTNPSSNNTITTNQFKTVSLMGCQESSNTGQTPQEALDTQQCKICGIATTSYDQMLLHLKGTRHSKKLRALGEPPISNLFDKSPTTILESLDSNNPSDVSMYRTPSGSYYCKTCNAGLEDVARIKKHISSKAHLAAVKKNNAEKTVKT